MNKAKTLKQVVEEQRNSIMKIPGVIGIAAGLSRSGSGEKCIIVYTTVSEWPVELPRRLAGFTVEIVRKKKGFRIF